LVSIGVDLTHIGVRGLVFDHPITRCPDHPIFSPPLPLAPTRIPKGLTEVVPTDPNLA
jgi:hypothetical protein